MLNIKPKFIVDRNGRKKAVLMELSQYRRFLRKIEDLEDALTLDRAETNSKKLLDYTLVRKRLQRAGKL